MMRIFCWLLWFLKWVVFLRIGWLGTCSGGYLSLGPSFCQVSWGNTSFPHFNFSLHSSSISPKEWYWTRSPYSTFDLHSTCSHFAAMVIYSTAYVLHPLTLWLTWQSLRWNLCLRFKGRTLSFFSQSTFLIINFFSLVFGSLIFGWFLVHIPALWLSWKGPFSKTSHV